MYMGCKIGSLSLATHTHTQLQCGPLVVVISDLSEDRPGRKKESQ